MTKQEINNLLEKAYRSNFLDSIELLTVEQKNYKRSEFFKTTRIPLLELYKNYFANKVAKNDLQAQIEKFILEFNYDIAAEKAIEFIEKLSENEKLKETLDKILRDFDPSKIDDFSKQLEGAIKNLKK